MSAKPWVPAIEGWFSLDPQAPHLIGTTCTKCGTYYFPRQAVYCKNPLCTSTDFVEVALSRSGTIWSYTNACYKPPSPYVAAEPFQPFAIAAVKLEKEQMIILGQVVKGVGVADLKVGAEMELALETLYEDAEKNVVTWKWQPLRTTRR